MNESNLLDLAYKIAQRSPVRRFQTGAVIEKNGEVLSTGWSHASERNMACYRSMHAEMHAITRADIRDTIGATIGIITISRKSGNRTDGAPCWFCLNNIKKFGIEKIVFSTPGGGSKIIYADAIDLAVISEGFERRSRKAYVGDLLC
jgi:deoxycytidylate deaminase